MSLAGLQNSWGGGDAAATAAATDVPYLGISVVQAPGGPSVVGIMPGTTAGVAPAPLTPALNSNGNMSWSLSSLIPGMGQTDFPAEPPVSAYTQYAGVATITVGIGVDAAGLAYLEGVITPTATPPTFTFGWTTLPDAQFRRPSLSVSGASLVAAGSNQTYLTLNFPIYTQNPADLAFYMQWSLPSLAGAPAAAGWMSVTIESISVTPLAPYTSIEESFVPAYAQP